MSFHSWLVRQCDRDDPVGDLARDVRDDQDMPDDLKRSDRPEDWRSYLAAAGACSGAMAALDRALHEAGVP